MRRIVAGSLYVAVVVVLAAVAAWPIYRSGAFLVLVVVASALGAAVAAVRAASERAGNGDFSPLWAGQRAAGCRQVDAAVLTRELMACK